MAKGKDNMNGSLLRRYGIADRRYCSAFQLAAGIVVIGSAWGMLECVLGGMHTSLAGIEISTGAVLAGVFGIGFMTLALRLFRGRGIILAIGIIAGLLRFAAPVGSCVICSSIAIVAEAAVFELVMKGTGDRNVGFHDG